MTDAYPDVVARFYDVVYERVRAGVDHAYYLQAMRAARGPTLEIGSGTGRLLRAALHLGLDAWGVDVSPAMVARCRAGLAPHEQARAAVADARQLDLGRRFALIAAPFRVLSHVGDVADQLRLLERVHAHLEPGGRFLFDLYVPNLRLLLEGLPEHCDFDGEHAPGLRLRRLVASDSADLARQTNHVRMTFEWEESDGARQREVWEFDMRFYFRHELEHLLARSPLRLETLHGDFEGAPFNAAAREFVVACRRDD